MRTRFLILVLLAALLPSAALAAGQAHLRPTAFNPLAVRGTGFLAHERVTVTVRAGTTTFLTQTTSSSTGAFTARFSHSVAPGSCAGLAVTAVGARGDKASWKAPPPMCGTELGP